MVLKELVQGTDEDDLGPKKDLSDAETGDKGCLTGMSRRITKEAMRKEGISTCYHCGCT